MSNDDEPATMLRRSFLRAPGGGGCVMVVAAVPFAVATAWTVVMPLTAVLMLAIGLPHVLGRPHSISSVGGTS